MLSKIENSEEVCSTLFYAIHKIQQFPNYGAGRASLDYFLCYELAVRHISLE